MIYKLYIGDYEPKGGMCAAPKMILPSVKFTGLAREIQDGLKIVKHGLDLYVVKPNGKAYGWYRDLVHYSKEERKELLCCKD